MSTKSDTLRHALCLLALFAVTFSTSVGFSEEATPIARSIFVAKTVNADGSAAAGVHVQVIQLRTRAVVAQATSDAQGVATIQLEVPKATRYRVDVRGNGKIFDRQYDLPVSVEDMCGNVSSREGLAINAVPGKTLERTFRVVPAVRIRGRITTSGSPLNARVHFALISEYTRDGRPMCVPLKPISTTSINVDGTYEVFVHAHGERAALGKNPHPQARVRTLTKVQGLVVVAYTDDGGLGWATTAKRKITKGIVADVDIELRPTRTVTVRASSPDGTPVSGVSVRADLIVDGGPELKPNTTRRVALADGARTSADGTVQITHVPTTGRIETTLIHKAGDSTSTSNQQAVTLIVEEQQPASQTR